MGNEPAKEAVDPEVAKAQAEYEETLPLEPGWKVDTTSDNKKYYWHPDGRRQYTRPCIWVAAPDQEDTPEDAEATAPIPPGWHEDVGGKLGENKRFYWHDDGRRQWERPKPAEGATPGAAAAPLERGWHADVAGPGAKEPGKAFYWHDDGRRQWNHPNGEPAEEEALPGPLPKGWHGDISGALSKEPGKRFYWNDDGRRQWEHPNPAKVAGPVEEPLPDGWAKGIAGVCCAAGSDCV